MELAAFIDSFVLPLLGGGPVHVERPLRPRDRDEMVEDRGELHRPELLFVRMRRASALTPHPSLPDPDLDELSLWIALHNTLVFDHPERHRVWARGSTWRRAEGATRSLMTLAFPTEVGEGLVRHVSVGAFLELTRADTILPTATGDLRYLGQSVPRRLFGVPGPTNHREELVHWLGQPHAPESHRLVEDAMRASPLTCLLEPLLAPAGWSPLWAVDFLKDRALCRAVVHRWAAHKDWIAAGGAVMAALLPSLPQPRRRNAADANEGAVRTDGVAALPPADDEGPRALPGAVLPTSPDALAAVVGALIHLHFLKVLELDARLGVALGSRDPGILSFLALPLLLPWLQEVTGTPLGGLPGQQARAPFEAQAFRRWTEYVDHLEELVPRSVLENLLATLVPPIVQTS